MQVRVVIQTHPDGQVNVCLSNDPTIDQEDLLAHGDGWEKAEVRVGKVLLIGEPNLVDVLLKTELRSVDNSADLGCRTVDALATHLLLKENL